MTATLNAMACPQCGGPTWDNRGTKTKSTQPDYKCRNRACNWAQWPPKDGAAPAPAPTAQKPQAPANAYVGDLPGDPGAVDWTVLAARYKECVVYVVKEIVPGLTKLDVGSDPQSVAAMAATIFIARQKAGV